jgi:hypothetical protein
MGLLDRIDGQKKLQAQKSDAVTDAEVTVESKASEETVEDPYLEIKRLIHSAIIDELNRNGKLKKGDVVLLTAFGGGLTWGAELIRW